MATPSAIAKRLGFDASTLGEIEEAPPPAGDLRDEVDTYVGLDACVSRHAKIDPLFGDALLALGYDSFPRDACRFLEAIKTKKREACTPIAATPLRDRCFAMEAMATNDPEACPFVFAGRPTEGRNVSCLAAAVPDVRLCAAADRGERAACEALARRDEKLCGGGRGATVCRREVARWARVGESAPPARRVLETTASLHLEAKSGPVTVPPSLVVSEFVSRGVVLEERLDGEHVLLGELTPTPLLSARVTSPRFAVEIVLGRTEPLTARVAQLALDVPGSPRFACPGAGCHVEASADGGIKRGSPLGVRVKGTLDYAGRQVAIELSVATFVRDLVKLDLTRR